MQDRTHCVRRLVQLASSNTEYYAETSGEKPYICRDSLIFISVIVFESLPHSIVIGTRSIVENLKYLQTTNSARNEHHSKKKLKKCLTANYLSFPSKDNRAARLYANSRRKGKSVKVRSKK